jgi:hypothetical protein
MELADIEAAEVEAAYSLGDFAHEAIRSKKHLSKLEIIVRDDDGVVLNAEINFQRAPSLGITIRLAGEVADRAGCG